MTTESEWGDRSRATTDPGLAARLVICKDMMKGRHPPLSVAAGIKASTWNNYWTGKREPKVGQIVKIADACGVTLDWLAAGRGPMLEEERKPYQVTAVDAELLRRVLEILDAVAREQNTVFSSAARAHVAALVYSMVADNPLLQADVELSKLMKSLASIGRSMR